MCVALPIQTVVSLLLASCGTGSPVPVLRQLRRVLDSLLHGAASLSSGAVWSSGHAASLGVVDQSAFGGPRESFSFRSRVGPATERRQRKAATAPPTL